MPRKLSSAQLTVLRAISQDTPPEFAAVNRTVRSLCEMGLVRSGRRLKRQERTRFVVTPAGRKLLATLEVQQTSLTSLLI
jgi:DNA-binding MarR family transcriptional regulator